MSRKFPTHHYLRSRTWSLSSADSDSSEDKGYLMRRFLNPEGDQQTLLERSRSVSPMLYTMRSGSPFYETAVRRTGRSGKRRQWSYVAWRWFPFRAHNGSKKSLPKPRSQAQENSGRCHVWKGSNPIWKLFLWRLRAVCGAWCWTRDDEKFSGTAEAARCRAKGSISPPVVHFIRILSWWSWFWAD